MNKSLRHYGTPRHSGRYPWGSGDDPQQRSKSFLGYVDALKKEGMSQVDIAKGLGMTTTELRAKKSIAKAELKKIDYTQAIKLKDKGYSNVEIGRRIGRNESYVRSLLDPVLQERANITSSVANMLKESVEKKDYIDVGVGIENHIGVSRTRLKTAIAMLKEEGYTTHEIKVAQLGTQGQYTNMLILARPGVTRSEVSKNRDKIRMITDYSDDGGRSWLGLKPIQSVDSKRIQIRYADQGGADKDGVIELRRGVDDISLGNSKYAQVRIGVDGTHYLKGMAMYSDDLPKGVDIIFNTNKKTNSDMHAAMKVMSADMNDPKAKSIQALKISKEEKERLLKKGVEDGSIKPDPDNPFGATIKANGQRGALNIVNEEGDWEKWSKTLSSQMLSKQSRSLAKQQLKLAYDAKREEFDEIMTLTNPAVKRRLLDGFADDCDSSAVHLKAAAMAGQGSHVILPFPNMKETEIYAPNYMNGTPVVLIRYPHGGRFEIPELKVNNKHAGAKSVIAGAKDAVGINPKVAERLSGADFDGDTVLVIPNPHGAIKTESALKGLANFDPKEMYKINRNEISYSALPKISSRTKQMEMGNVSNLITDMTIKGANLNEIARAVRHSMVVIDAEKHDLDYKQSYIDNGIAGLKERYQGGKKRGASTLISRAASKVRVNARKETIDPETGKKRYSYTGETRMNKDGEISFKTIKSTKMAETEDAFTLSSGTPMETVYATHANSLKALANASRKESINTPYTRYSASAKKAYEPEVASLKAQLNLALKNKPLERQAQLLANTVVAAKRHANPDMEPSDIKKLKGQALTEARVRVGAKKYGIEISDREWEAIQAGAISTNTLTQILSNTDLDRVKQLATPRTSTSLTPAKLAKAKTMLSAGYTRAEVANALGISTSSLAKSIG